MEYIECTHCGKRYAASEKIKKVEGEFVRCKNCAEKFMLVVHDTSKNGAHSKEQESFSTSGTWDPTLTSAPDSADSTAEENNESMVTTETDWDPSMTMPEEEPLDEEPEEELSDDEIEAKAQATLKAIQDAKKKKIIMIFLLAVITLLLSLTLYMALPEDEEEVVTPVVIEKRLSAADMDRQNLACRTAAARQWLIDYQAMYGNNTGQAFTKLVKQSQSKTEQVKEACKNPELLKNILDAVIEGKQPDWLASEIKALSR